MARKMVAKLFRNGRSRAVRLPQEFRFEGKQVRLRRVCDAVALEPLISDVKEWFAKLDSLNTAPFLTCGRNQPKPPRRKIFE